ncbi:type III secretion system export apparatus subunit SctS [uncultured Tateyamaria sp.]|uniref:type III secretion system export apparatus subunit SctS n=1 Tax=uncultured Tateyamaria sp. TaxID=455651 RepID=UPI0026249E0A|nr:type III secretion system export apparatus subunit SctS [uncultured Tateyamaria sp.]
MTEDSILYLAKASLTIIYEISFPIIAAATLVGLLVALLQTLIQLQEQTLSFGMKLLAIGFVLSTAGPWMASEMMNFMNIVFGMVEQGQF